MSNPYFGLKLDYLLTRQSDLTEALEDSVSGKMLTSASMAGKSFTWFREQKKSIQDDLVMVNEAIKQLRGERVTRSYSDFSGCDAQ